MPPFSSLPTRDEHPCLSIRLLFAGQTLQFTGASKVHEDTGEVLREPHHSLDAQIAEVCALYT